MLNWKIPRKIQSFFHFSGSLMGKKMGDNYRHNHENLEMGSFDCRGSEKIENCCSSNFNLFRQRNSFQDFHVRVCNCHPFTFPSTNLKNGIMPSLNTQSCISIMRPLFSTFRFENLSISPKNKKKQKKSYLCFRGQKNRK